MAILWLCLVFNMIILTLQLNPELMISSTANITQFLLKEGQLGVMFENVLDAHLQVPIQHYIAGMKLSKECLQYNTGTNESISYVDHPINIYNLVRRWMKFQEFAENDEEYNELATPFSQLNLPQRNDYKGAIVAILRLQKVYGLEIDDLLNGIVDDVHSAEGIPLEDSIEFGNMAYMIKEYGLAAQWFERGLSDNDVCAGLSQERTLAIAYRKMVEIYTSLGDAINAYLYAKKAYEILTDNEEITEIYKTLKNIVDNLPSDYTPTTNAKNWRKKQTPVQNAYESLCNKRPDYPYNGGQRVAQTLFCEMRSSISVPYLQYKEEIVSHDPKIVIFYDVISSDEVFEAVKYSYKKLKSEPVREHGGAQYSDARNAKVHWLSDDTSTLVHTVSKRIEDITGLATAQSKKYSKSEPYEMVNYGIAGHYEPHYDYYHGDINLKKGRSADLVGTGDRMATFQMYVTVPHHGGGTVFPKIDVYIPPVANSAVFWYNLKKNGEKDTRTANAACPVLVGLKWVMNKWIMERGQEFRRSCGLTPDERD